MLVLGSSLFSCVFSFRVPLMVLFRLSQIRLMCAVYTEAGRILYSQVTPDFDVGRDMHHVCAFDALRGNQLLPFSLA
jgi:hypothetical protein